MRFFSSSIGLLLLVSMSLLLCPMAKAVDMDDDEDMDNEEDSIINDEGAPNTEDTTGDGEEEADTGVKSTASPFVKANILFIQPESTDMPAGRLVKVLVSFHNNGTDDFIVDSIEGSFRYPQDFSYHIQNFTAFTYNKVIEAEKEATFEYMFTPSETFSSRQFGFILNMRYRNADDTMFMNTVFNDTVSIVEPDEGIDGETFFLYIFLAALLVLGLVALQQFFSVFTKKTRRATKTNYATSQSTGGSSGGEEIDYEWIPKEHLQSNKSPSSSPRKRGLRSGASGNSSNDE